MKNRLMKTRYFLDKTIQFILLLGFLFPVNLIVEPYLQDATPNSIYILWETDSNTDSIVEWGMYVFLTEMTTGSSISNYGSSRIHAVQLTELEPETRYYYRVVYDGNYSEVYNFITPPLPSSENSFQNRSILKKSMYENIEICSFLSCVIVFTLFYNN